MRNQVKMANSNKVAALELFFIFPFHFRDQFKFISTTDWLANEFDLNSDPHRIRCQQKAPCRNINIHHYHLALMGVIGVGVSWHLNQPVEDK